jgi:hypothetical protein
MAVLSVVEKPGGRKAGLKPQGERTFDMVFIVTCTQPMEESLTILNASANGVAIPKVGYIWPFDQGLVCAEVTPSQNEEQPRVWEVSCHFTSWRFDLMGGRRDDIDQRNPLTFPPEISFGANKYVTYPLHMLNGTLWRNHAGDPFDPPPAIDESRQTIHIVRNEATFDPATARTWADVLNSDTWWGFAPRTVKLSCPTARRDRLENVWFWQVTYDFEVCGKLWGITLGDNQEAPGWQPVVLNAGYRYLDANGRLTTPVNDDGPQYGGRVLLDFEGHQIPRGGNPKWVTAKSYVERAFSALNLP